MKSLPACLPAVASLDNRMSVWEGQRCLMVLTCQKPSLLHWMTLSVTHDRCQCSMQRPLLHRSDCRRWLFYSSLFSIGKPWAQPSLHLPSAEMADVSLHSCPPQWMTRGPVLRKVVLLHCWLWLWEVRSWTFCVGITGRTLCVWEAAACPEQELAELLTGVVRAELLRPFDQQGLWLHVHAACHNVSFS